MRCLRSGAYATVFKLAVFAAAVMYALSWLLLGCSECAYADGGLQCTGIHAYQELDEVSPEPLGSPLLYVEFDKNVSFAQPGTDDSWARGNAARVHLMRADGTTVEDAVGTIVFDQSERKTIPVHIREWLDPLAEYTVVVDEGVVAGNGSDMTDRPYEFTFKTSALCADGLTAYEHALRIAVPVLLLVGVAAMAVRVMRRER